MTRTIFYTATTLDGHLAEEHDSLAWLFAQPEGDEGGGPGPFDYEAFVAGVGALVVGRTTYDWVLRHEGHWPFDLPTWLFTHRPVDAPEHVRVVAGDPADHWEAIAAEVAGRDVWMMGGGDLAVAFARAGHLDELWLSVAPVTLGAGRPLLPAPFDLELREAVRHGPFACLRYGVVGPGSWG